MKFSELGRIEGQLEEIRKTLATLVAAVRGIQDLCRTRSVHVIEDDHVEVEV